MLRDPGELAPRPWTAWSRQPLSLSLDDLERMPRASYTVKHHCVEGWTAIASWAGVPVSEIVLR